MGNSGRNILQGPGTKTVDFSFFKNTNIAESKVLQLRAEFFNLFNTPQFNNPNSTVGIYNAATGSWSNSFGTISRPFGAFLPAHRENPVSGQNHFLRYGKIMQRQTGYYGLPLHFCSD